MPNLMPKSFFIKTSKKTFFTVGPSQIYPTVPSHIQKTIKTDILSMSHRSQEFRDIYRETVDGLKKLLNIPPEYQIVFVSSALEAMERILQSMSHNKQSFSSSNTFHILTGFFGKTWMDISNDLGKSTDFFQFFDWEKNSYKAIKQLSYKAPDTFFETEFENIKIPEKSELVCITQNDTSVGFSIPMEEIYALRKKYPNKLFALDIVSSAPYIDIEYKYLDAVFFSVQKGFGLPAGLCILILSPKAVKKAQKLSSLKGYSTGSYHSLVKLVENSKKFQTVETPNVLGIYLLGCVVKDFLKIGIRSLRQRLDRQAQMLYSFFSGSGFASSFIKEERYQSKTTPVFEIAKGSEGLRKFAAVKGLILGAGYKDFKNKHIRIGNFPALTVKNTKRLLTVLRNFQQSAN